MEKQRDRIRILVVDDHFVVRMGLKAVLDAQVDMQVVADAANGCQAVEMFQQHTPDVVLMDLRMPVMTGVEATRQIRRESPKAAVIVLTTYDGDEDIYRALQAGARGYLLKDAMREELLIAIRKVYSGQRYIPAPIAARLAERIPLSDLTPRELEVLSLIVKGLNNSDIAIALSISRGTVKVHINNILGKLDVSDRTQAATTALQRGIVHLE
ncbi:MAG TPA: response regulator transcription factor [Blastocatellia bacterium]|nr:response regulator transcription factor [Blastocatellia bacterium]